MLNKTIREQKEQTGNPNAPCIWLGWQPFLLLLRTSWEAELRKEKEINKCQVFLVRCQTHQIIGSSPKPTWREVRGFEAVLSIMNVRTGKVCCPRPKIVLVSHANTLSPWYNYKHPPIAQRVPQTVTWSCAHILSHRHPVCHILSVHLVHLVPLTVIQPQSQTRSPQITVTATSPQIVYIPSTLLPTQCHTVTWMHTVTAPLQWYSHTYTHSAVYCRNHTPTM